MASRKKKDLHTDVTKSTKSDNIVVRILKAGITHVETGWRQFEIAFKERIIDDGDLVHGLVDFDKYEISLDPRMDSAFALETVLHELTHIVLENGGLGESEKGKVATKMDNEDMTILVSRGLLQLYRLNPKLMAIASELMCKETPFK